MLSATINKIIIMSLPNPNPNVAYNSISIQELVDAQAHLWNLIFNYINSMCLKSAIQLGIPDIIHKHGKPITLSQLANTLSIDKAKSNGLHRLMRILVHFRIFNKVNLSEDKDEDEDEEEAYSLTQTSRLLLRDEPLSFAPFALAMIDPHMMDPFHHATAWFKDESPSPSPFFTKNGISFFECTGIDKNWNKMFNEGMASDSKLVATTLSQTCRHVFEGLKTMVDVGGGTGTVAEVVADTFPDLKCIVLDLPHVVSGLEGTVNLSFLSGNMFEFIPPCDAVFLKWILHDWSDEECVKILEKCKEAILPSKDNGGKVIILEMVVDDERENPKATETQLCFDMLMMNMVTGKERTQKEWAKLFSAAGFGNYKITPILGLRSVIEVFL